MGDPESEKPRQKSGKILRRMTRISLKSGKFLDSLEVFRTVWRIFQTVWKVSLQFGKFPASLDSFRTVWKVSRQSGQFLDSLESFRPVWTVSGQSGKFPDSLNSFRTVCGENNLRTLSVKFLREKVCRPESWEFLGLQGDQGVIKPMGTVWKGI